MSKLSGTNKKILPKQRIAPAVRPLVPISNWWKFKGNAQEVAQIKGTKIFKLKNQQSEGVLACSTAFGKNYLQNSVKSYGLLKVVKGTKKTIFDLSGNRHKNGFSAQG